jgi:dTDP-4-amino-4,6-dideoxygalactose transaminase
MKNIPFFNYPALFAEHETELTGVILDVCRRGAYILQRDLADFEKNLAEYMGVKHAFGVANGTDAIWLGLMACGIGPGDEVILPSHTYIATGASVHFVGATPVLADIGPDHMLDPTSVESLITKRTKAILPVQVNGRTCDMDALQAIADQYGLMIVEDSAQGLGSKFKDRMAGTFGRFGTSSFYPAKLLGCLGDGGAVVTNDDETADRLALLRDHGRHPKTGKVVAWGFNSRLDNLQAAILDFKLKTFDLDVAKRRTIAARYQNRLGDLAEMTLPPGPGSDPRHFDSFQNYEVEADQRDKLRTYLESQGIRTIIQWAGTPIHQFDALGFKDSKLPATDNFFKRCFLLPMNTTLSDEDVDYICDHIRNFYGHGA